MKKYFFINNAYWKIMKHFAVFIKYKADLNDIISIQDIHRNILKQGVENEVILVSGPFEPRTGGLVIMRSESIATAKDFFKDDPYLKNNYAEYSFYEFKPGKHQSFLNEWIEKN